MSPLFEQMSQSVAMVEQMTQIVEVCFETIGSSLDTNGSVHVQLLETA